MSWYARTRLWLFSVPALRRAALTLGGMALALGLGWTMAGMQTARMPAPAGAQSPLPHARVQEAHAQGDDSSSGARTTADASPPSVLEQKNDCLRKLIALHLERRRIMAQLEANHPALREIPPLQKWLDEMPVKQHPAGARQWQALLKNDPVMNQRFFELMVLKSAGVWMRLLTDPKISAWYAEAFETARLSATAAHDMAVLDATTNFNDEATARPTTPAEVVSAYALRAPAYGVALQSNAEAWGLQITPEMDDYLEAMAQQRLMRSFLRQYQESLTTDALKQVQSGIGALQAQFMDLPATVKADAELLAQLRQAAGE